MVMHRMLQTDKPTDYMIASESTYSLREFADAAFSHENLDQQDRLEINYMPLRSSQLSVQS